MWSIFYLADGELFSIGPFDTEDKAMAAARKAGDPANKDREFCIDDQRVYLLHPDHRRQELSADDLFPETVNEEARPA